MKPGDTKRLQELAKSAKDAPEEKLNAICRNETQIVFGPYLLHPDGHERDWKAMCDVPSAAMRNVAVVNPAINSSLGDFDLQPTLAKLKVPVLVIEGEKTNVPPDSTREWRKLQRTRGCY
jgi:pimeloyl-ACP methyl ester carboxylesterase